MKIEDVSGVGLPAGGTAEQQRHLSVGDGLEHNRDEVARKASQF